LLRLIFYNRFIDKKFIGFDTADRLRARGRARPDGRLGAGRNERITVSEDAHLDPFRPLLAEDADGRTLSENRLKSQNQDNEKGLLHIF
jgi:hypothetical protein